MKRQRAIPHFVTSTAFFDPACHINSRMAFSIRGDTFWLMRSSKKMRAHLAKVFAKRRKAEAQEDRKVKPTAVKSLIDGLKR